MLKAPHALLAHMRSHTNKQTSECISICTKRLMSYIHTCIDTHKPTSESKSICTKSFMSYIHTHAFTHTTIPVSA
jgi:hypothetical protein